MRELRNPFRNAVIVATDYDPAKYHVTGKRGIREFVMSRGELMTFAACPQKWLRGVEDESTKQTEFGVLFDSIVLSNRHFFERFAICPETYPDSKTKEPKPWTFQANFCKEWRTEQEKAGKIVVKQDANGQAHAAADRLLTDEVSKTFVDCCATQVYLTGDYEDEETGLSVPVKALLDLVPDVNHPIYGKCLGDLKTCRSAADGRWPSAVAEDGLHVQGAFYLDLFCAATNQDRNTFVHLCVENSAPWEPSRTFLTQEFLEFGRMDYLNALRRYCECLKTGTWPSYNHAGNSWPTLPGWRKCEPPQWLLKRFTE